MNRACDNQQAWFGHSDDNPSIFLVPIVIDFQPMWIEENIRRVFEADKVFPAIRSVLLFIPRESQFVAPHM